VSKETSNTNQPNLPGASDLAIAGDALQAYLNAPDSVDRFLFRAFTPENIAVLKDKITTPTTLVRNDWDQLSLFLRSVALSLDPFPDLDKRYTHGELYDAIDRIAEYALNLPDTPPNRTQQGRGPSHER
jgi:hypothetical protein